MKKNDLLDTKALDIKSLNGRVGKLKVEIVDLVLDKNMNKLKDTSVIRKKRKDLAQVLTVLRQKVLLAEMENNEKKSNKEVKDK